MSPSGRKKFLVKSIEHGPRCPRYFLGKEEPLRGAYSIREATWLIPRLASLMWSGSIGEEKKVL